MKPQVTLYTRKDCCLCDDMKEVIRRVVAAGIPLDLKEIDIDSAPELRKGFGNEVPVLFIAGRKAFKYAVTQRQLRKRLARSYGLGETLARKILMRVSPSKT